MVMSITIDHRDFLQDMKKLGLDLRVSARRIMRDIADDLVEESITNMFQHSKTHDMEDNIYQVQDSQWSRIVFFGDARFLDSGSKPHSMPPDEAERMAGAYGMTKWQFWGMVKKYGTQAHPFIDESENAVLNRIDMIMERELNRIMK